MILCCDIPAAIYSKSRQITKSLARQPLASCQQQLCLFAWSASLPAPFRAVFAWCSHSRDQPNSATMLPSKWTRQPQNTNERQIIYTTNIRIFSNGSLSQTISFITLFPTILGGFILTVWALNSTSNACYIPGQSCVCFIVSLRCANKLGPWVLSYRFYFIFLALYRSFLNESEWELPEVDHDSYQWHRTATAFVVAGGFKDCAGGIPDPWKVNVKFRCTPTYVLTQEDIDAGLVENIVRWNHPSIKSISIRKVDISIYSHTLYTWNMFFCQKCVRYARSVFFCQVPSLHVQSTCLPGAYTWKKLFYHVHTKYTWSTVEDSFMPAMYNAKFLMACLNT